MLMLMVNLERWMGNSFNTVHMEEMKRNNDLYSELSPHHMRWFTW